MSEPKSKPKPFKGSSGEHRIMHAVRAKMDSIQEVTLPMLREELEAKLAEAIAQAKSEPPIALDSELLDDDADTPVVKDPRREDDGEPPIDIFEEDS